MPTVDVLGSTAQIEKVLTSLDPAVVGATVTFRVRLSITGDSDVTEVVFIDTFEHDYLEFVSSSGSCELVPNSPDTGRSSLECEIGTVSPAVDGGAAGTDVFEYDLTFNAVSSTLPGRTVNEAVALLDFDGDGPGARAAIGPATADVEIIEILGLQLPPTGDGSTSDGSRAWMLVAVVLGAASFGAASGRVWTRRTNR